jgi:hypothetical protein
MNRFNGKVLIFSILISRDLPGSAALPIMIILRAIDRSATMEDTSSTSFQMRMITPVKSGIGLNLSPLHGERKLLTLNS